MESFHVQRTIRMAALSVLLVGLMIGAASAQESMVEMEYNPASAPAQGAYNVRYHIMRAHTDAGLNAPLEGSESGPLSGGSGAAPSLFMSIPAVPAPGFYPGDVTRLQSGAPTLTSTVWNPIFVNCGSSVSSCWGNPTAFLSDLGKSSFIHLTDQYTGKTTNGRYTLGTSFHVAVTPSDFCMIGGTNPCLTDEDIQRIVNSAASKGGHGYGHIYHVFLPKNFDECQTDSMGNIAGCYSPDVPQEFTLCAYHGSANQSVGHIVYSVEPFQNVSGCQEAPPFANGRLDDSTDSTLSHETFEAITDPDLDAFQDLKAAALYRDEIADTCEGPPAFDSSGNYVGSRDPTVTLNSRKYRSQAMYSNYYHACAVGPPP